eukprot:gb/GECG01011589.1/.p1 GENE.gb/GECG01011589.1/~~gb/GECG01011589.1/.p1  ORF type:complete len:491 (+),score=53.25 gb/GECG01011589.1/:1-1473(+)
MMMMVRPGAVAVALVLVAICSRSSPAHYNAATAIHGAGVGGGAVPRSNTNAEEEPGHGIIGAAEARSLHYTELHPRQEPSRTCIHYKSSENLFYLSCSFRWFDYFNASDFISLAANEVFDGRDYEIDMDGITDFEGFIGIINSVSSLREAPIIKNVHMRNGATSVTGGFIIRPYQKFFFVDSCSSSGTISGLDGYPFAGGGGIVGQECAANGGHAVISNCYSTGNIGYSAGGIAGRELAKQGGAANVTNCHSYGIVEGRIAGGIVGRNAAMEGGKVFVKGCYSKGDIVGRWSGGICGASPGVSNGRVHIAKSFSTGDINGQQSGALAGAWSGSTRGNLFVKNAYSTGNLNGENTGGVCGGLAGHKSGYVLIKNAYSSGLMRGTGVGGIIGSVDGVEPGQVVVQYSVYNGGGTGRTNVDTEAGLITKDNSNSNNINDIYGKIYCHKHGCWDERIWRADPNGYPKLLLPKPKVKMPPNGQSQFLEQLLVNPN